ncbi:hypothetical protein TWF694_005398 [Orbilia ellipsospora]|uniref:Uncharacterized protein n=1 Tax=Orbilia ellipsospora TaxID=2528407 RepID=A0AAV9WVF9_9PEZI
MKITYLAVGLFAALAAAGPQRITVTDDNSTRIQREMLKTTTKHTTTPKHTTTRTTTKKTTTRSTRTTITPRTTITLNPPAHTPTGVCTLSLCADMVNECGMMYGGCFPACPGWPTPQFTPPPCPTATKCDQQICVDDVNECGMMFGGCFDACPGSPTPTFVPPPCPPGSKTKTPRDKIRLVL